MNTLYLWLNIGSISIPFIYSFHPRLQLYKKFHWLFISLMITMAVFIPWDVIFTINGIWGFNPDYFLNTKILSLPLEEWLFFICIPFACVFTHYALLLYFPKMKLGENSSKSIAVGFLCHTRATVRDRPVPSARLGNGHWAGPFHRQRQRAADQSNPFLNSRCPAAGPGHGRRHH